jgi:hypothetical protein
MFCSERDVACAQTDPHIAEIFTRHLDFEFMDAL